MELIIFQFSIEEWEIAASTSHWRSGLNEALMAPQFTRLRGSLPKDRAWTTTPKFDEKKSAGRPRFSHANGRKLEEHPGAVRLIRRIINELLAALYGDVKRLTLFRRQLPLLQ
jgi:hypothetical protein